MLPSLTPMQWLVAALSALCIGVNKSGLPGLSLLYVAAYAQLFPGQASTGIVLPMLIAGDFSAVWIYRRQAQWRPIVRTLPVALAGVVAGWGLMQAAPNWNFQRIIGGIVLTLVAVQYARHWRPTWFLHLPQSIVFAIAMGLIAGVTTMLANAAGPVMAVYFLVIGLAKEGFVGTMSWFFLLLNLFKLPFSWNLGLIHPTSLTFNAVFLPLIVAGVFLGRWLVRLIPQKTFDSLVLALAAVAALRLLTA